MPDASSDNPTVSQSSLKHALTEIGIEPGMTLAVHSSLRSIGWVQGGAGTVVQALIDSVGQQGTIVMPAATPIEHDEQSSTLPPVFNPNSTPTTLGAIPETLRTWPGTLRSDHPLESVCARGPKAANIVQDHPLAYSEGPGSPYAKVSEAGGWVLLLGVGFNRCTALHYAESLVTKHRKTEARYTAIEDGQTVWKSAPNVADDNDTHFPVIGERFMATGQARTPLVGNAPAMLFRMQELVEFACEYFEQTL